MKTFTIISAIVLSSVSVLAQNNPAVGMVSEFKSISNFGTRQSGYEAIQTYSSNEVKGSQFLYPTFQDGSVTTQSGQVIDSLYQFLFDKVRQILFIKYKSDKRTQPEIILADKGQIKAFTINTDKKHVFKPASEYDPKNTTDFYEVLVQDDSGYTLLKNVTASFVKSDPKDIEKMRNGDMSDEFVDKVTYYLSYKGQTPQKLKLKGNNKDAFPASQKPIVDNFYKAHADEDRNETFLVNMFNAFKK